MKIDWTQSSTQRGAIWVIVAIIGTVGWWMGKDISQVLLLGAGIAGGLGVATNDK